MSDTSPQNGTVAPSWWQRITMRQVALGTALVALILLGVFLLVALRYVWILMFMGIVLATALSPVAERLKSIGASRSVAAALSIALLLVLVGAVIAALIPFFIAQVTAVLSDLPQRYAGFRESLASSPSRLVRDLTLFLPLNPLSGVATPSEQEQPIEVVVAGVVVAFLRGAGFTALVLLLSYYWLYYRSFAVQAVALLVPLNWRNDAIEVWNKIEIKIGAFVRGLAILGISIGLLSFIGYSLIGLPYAVTIGIIAGVLEAVPYVGPFLTMVIATVVGLTISPEKALLALVVANIVQLLENSIVVPRAMDKTVGVNPVVTLLALAVFGELFGLLGALLAVPLAAAIQVLLDQFVLSAPTVSQMDIGGRDQLALLRYRTQDLAGDLRQQVRAKELEPSAETDAEEEELEALLGDLDSLLATAQGQTV